MRAVDTNVLVRLFVHDQQEQSRVALELLSSGERFIVTITVLLETAWVLKSTGAPKPRVIGAIEALAQLPGIVVKPDIDMQRAIQLRRDGLDVADAIHVVAAVAVEGTALLTFDRRLAKRLPGFVNRL
jgi:predicted nucleic acid-binding protein